MRIDIVQPDENFGGMSYGQWAAEWNKWLFSEDPDTYDGGNVLFLRANPDYRPISTKKDSLRHADRNAIYDRTGSRGESILEGIAIFVPIITTVLFIGDNYEGKILRNEKALRYYVNKDTDDTRKMWAAIKRKGDKSAFSLVKNLEDYRFESPLFKLAVPKDSLLGERMEFTIKPGIYDAITAGYFIMIRSLPPSLYRINFGGEGMGIYVTNSVYDIEITRRKKHLRDSSSAVLKSKIFRFTSK
jgi:hypothetical protein